MIRLRATSFSRLAVFGILALMLTAMGCSTAMSPRPDAKSVGMMSTPSLLAEADKVWNQDDYPAAELYYSKALERSDLSQAVRAEALSRLGQAAYHNGHYRQAREALEKAANLDLGALSDSGWELAYLGTLKETGNTERLKNHLKWTLEQKALPWPVRQDVAVWYSGYFADKDDDQRALEVLAGFYKQAQSDADRAAFERTLRNATKNWEEGRLDDLAKVATPADQLRFPYALVAFERARRMADDQNLWPHAWRTMRAVANSPELVDRTSLGELLASYEKDFGIPRVGLVIAVPLTGPYGQVGASIVRGVGVAQWQLANTGDDVDVRVLNTANPGWVKRLEQLPESYSVVGGPLRGSEFKRLEEGLPGRRIIDARAVFGFMPGLGEAEEGDDAWRFFASREDEVKSLVQMAAGELGIKDFAVLYPREDFGRAMAKIFYKEATPLGVHIRGMESYDPKDLPSWNNSIAELLDVPDDFSENKEAPLPLPDFGAVFVPDGWRQAQNLLPNFFFYEGEQLIYLGPSLWSRALDRAKNIDEHYYRLAVCPGAWWKGSSGARNLQDALRHEGLGRADYWVALGYDFTRFAARMGVLPAGFDAEDVNERLASAAAMDFSMAPISWNEEGVASQELYLFSPRSHGKNLADPQKLKAGVKRATERRLHRAEVYKERMKEKAEGEQ